MVLRIITFSGDLLDVCKHVGQVSEVPVSGSSFFFSSFFLESGRLALFTVVEESVLTGWLGTPYRHRHTLETAGQSAIPSP